MVKKKWNKSSVFGILGIIFLLIPFLANLAPGIFIYLMFSPILGLIFSILAIVYGKKQNKINNSGSTGLTLGIIGVILNGLVLLWYLFVLWVFLSGDVLF